MSEYVRGRVSVEWVGECERMSEWVRMSQWLGEWESSHSKHVMHQNLSGIGPIHLTSAGKFLVHYSKFIGREGATNLPVPMCELNHDEFYTSVYTRLAVSESGPVSVCSIAPAPHIALARRKRLHFPQKIYWLKSLWILQKKSQGIDMFIKFHCKSFHQISHGKTVSASCGKS